MNKRINKLYITKLFSLIKHGIILGNLIPLIAGFFLAEKYFPQNNYPFLLFHTILWSLIVIAAGCVVNNWYDRDIDEKMQRTCKRVLPMKELPAIHALIFGLILCVIGLVGMFVFTNKTAGFVATFGLFSYVVLYTIFTKRNSVYGVHIGSISGAIPPVIGYTAVSGIIDINAFALFLIMVLWQMPHSFAIEIFRYDDYKNAQIPTVPSVKGIRWTKVSITAYILLFLVLNVYFSFKVGAIHFVASFVLCGYWMKIVRKFPKLKHQDKTPTENEKIWAKKVFIGSIVTMVGIFLSIILNLLV